MKYIHFVATGRDFTNDMFINLILSDHELILIADYIRHKSTIKKCNIALFYIFVRDVFVIFFIVVHIVWNLFKKFFIFDTIKNIYF